MALNPEQFHIKAATPHGMDLLEQSAVLQTALRLFGEAEEAHKARVPGSLCVNAGRYGYLFRIDGVAVKVTSPTSSLESFQRKKPLPPENLVAQYEVLSALWQHLRSQDAGVMTPEQFFVAHTPKDAYILAQEYMQGWMSIEEHTRHQYADIQESEVEEVRRAVKKWTQAIRQRLLEAVSDFEFFDAVDDLGFNKPSGVHGGNVLVPVGTGLDEMLPLCIIDQPGHELRESKRFKKDA